MASRLRAGAFATAAAAGLVAPILTAGPALAARPVITPDYCVEQGGAFSRLQGERRCLIPTSIRYQTFNDESFAQPVPGLVATWTRTVGQQESMLQTQKGNGPVQTTYGLISAYYVSQDITDKTCAYDDGTDQTAALVSLCDAAALYPPAYSG